MDFLNILKDSSRDPFRPSREGGLAAMLVTDPEQVELIKAERQRDGHDGRDEVWDGMYVIPPTTDNDHQEIASGFLFACHEVVNRGEIGVTFSTVNVSDRGADWMDNFREPDLAVFLKGNRSTNHETHWEGGPDLALEILSNNDPARYKVGFYGSIGVRELLIVDRDPWALELYQARELRLELAGKATLMGAEVLASEVLPLTFRLVPGPDRPRIEVARRDGGETWTF